MTNITRRGFVKGAAIAPLAVSHLGLGSSSEEQEPTSTAQASTASTQAKGTDRFDIVVAGGGHNSLVTAAYLSKASYRCLVLEGRPLLGGGVKTAELMLKGFHDDVCSSAHSFLIDNPMMRNNELRLGDYGLEYIDPDPVFHVPFPDGAYLTQWRDLDRTCAEFAKFSKKDALAYRNMIAEYELVKPIFEANTFTPVGFGKPVNDQLAQHPHGKLWQRRLAMSVWGIVRDSFEDDHCRAFMLASPWTLQPPLDPFTGRLAYITFHQQRQSRPLPKGGSGALAQALVRCIEAHHSAVLTNTWVTGLIVQN